MPTITRSRGTPTGYFGLMAGGGYSGATEDLDAAVTNAASLLAAAYPGRDVTIRFNSDRRSGGAWLVDGGNDAGIGITAGHYPDDGPYYALTRQLDAGEIGFKEWMKAHDSLPRSLHIFAHIGTAFLRSPDVATFRTDEPEHRYCHEVVPCALAALAFLAANAVDRESAHA